MRLVTGPPPGTATAAASAASRGRTVAGTALFVAGFSLLFASYGVAFGSLGAVLLSHQRILLQVLGGLTILLGLLFAGVFDRFPLAGRMLRPSARPRTGLGIGIPFLIVAALFQQGARKFAFARRHARLVTQFGGALLIIVGVLQVSGTWGTAMTWLKLHWVSGYQPPL